MAVTPKNSASAKLALAVWLALFATLAVSFLFWRIDYVRPHAAWAVASLLLIGVPLLGLLATTSWRLVRGPRRGAAAGWLLLGLTPLVWVGSFMTDLGLRSSVREPIAFGAPVRTIMVWASSVMDLEARLRYPRWTYGRHAVLLDRGETPEPARLVAQMDGHIEAMASLLGQPVPDCEFPWVRGPLVGQDGKAVGLWAMCGDQSSPAVLTYLDRHEVGHTLITALAGTDHYPPFLFIEGWAEAQSLDRDQMLLTLRDNRMMGEIYSLEELVNERWYYTGDGPVYWQGGPLVVYLMEHYGAEKFFDLYRGVHPRTFHADVERILGDSWEQVESEFWAWMQREVERIEKEQEAAAGGPRTRLILGDAVNKEDWQELVDGYRAKWGETWSVWRLPRNVAFELNSKANHNPRGDEKAHESWSKSGMRFTDEDLWVEYQNGAGLAEYFLVNSQNAARLSIGRNQTSPNGSVGGPDVTDKVRREVSNRLDWAYGDPGAYVPLRDGFFREGIFTIHELTRPAPGEAGPWTLSYNRRRATGVERCELVVDPALEWRVVRSQSTTSAGRVWDHTTEISYQRMGEEILPYDLRIVSFDYSGVARIEEQTWRPLTQAEQRSLKQRVEEVAWQGPQPPSGWLRRWMLAAVVGCPVLGAVLVGVRRGE